MSLCSSHVTPPLTSIGDRVGMHTPLTTCRLQHLSTVVFFIAPCVDFVAALHCASALGHVSCVDVLLTSSANVNSVDCSGCTPLFYAITRGHAHSVTSLLHHGANPNHVDLKGRTYVFCLFSSVPPLDKKFNSTGDRVLQ